MEQKIKEILANVLKIDVNKITDESSAENTPNWDSLRQMNIIIALEEEYEIEFSDDEIFELSSFKNIVKILNSKI